MYVLEFFLMITLVSQKPKFINFCWEALYLLSMLRAEKKQ